MRSAVTINLLILTLVAGAIASAEERSRGDSSHPSPARGYELLTTKPYLPPDFDQQTFDAAWKVWPEPLRSKAETATPDERRAMAYRRYGLTARPTDPHGRPLQYVVGEDGSWTMNCLACHQGTVAGRVIPGAPNTHYALETLTADVRATKIRLGKPLTRMDVGSLFMPLGGSNGTTNAVMFGVVLMSKRDADLNVISRPPPEMRHHDHDAPAWWNVSKKRRLYADDFAVKSHRALMQFLLVEENGPEKFREWEDDFRHVLAYIESLEPPKYPFSIDRELAERGDVVFEKTCSQCHGTYGPDGKYPEKVVPLKVVGTDPLRMQSLTRKHRADYHRSWFARYGQEATQLEPAGYLAPPLDGIWASAPYFHNGSVPTLWHVLHPEKRPVVWRRTLDGYDRAKVGLEVEVFSTLPEEVDRADERRTYFDTRLKGKSGAGHDFPASLTDDERRAVLEYLKSL